MLTASQPHSSFHTHTLKQCMRFHGVECHLIEMEQKCAQVGKLQNRSATTTTPYIHETLIEHTYLYIYIYIYIVYRYKFIMKVSLSHSQRYKLSGVSAATSRRVPMKHPS